MVLSVVGDPDTSRSLPRVPHPLFASALLGASISFTGLRATEKEALKERAEWLGALVTSEFSTATTTHLVAAEGGSKKYRVAVDGGVPVMRPSWITKAWEMAQGLASEFICFL